MSKNKNFRAINALKNAGKKLGSWELIEMSSKMTGPFDKVKKLIAKLIERLLTETKERDYKFNDIKELNADLENLEATKKDAEENAERLTEEISDAEKSQAEADEARVEEKENNTKTLKDAREGFEATK